MFCQAYNVDGAWKVRLLRPVRMLRHSMIDACTVPRFHCSDSSNENRESVDMTEVRPMAMQVTVLNHD